MERHIFTRRDLLKAVCAAGFASSLNGSARAQQLFSRSRSRWTTLRPSGGDDAPAIQAALDESGRCRLSSGRYRLSSPLLIRTGARLSGTDGTELLIEDDIEALRLSGRRVVDVELTSFLIKSTSSSRDRTRGLIQCDGPAVDGVLIEDVWIDARRNGRNGMFFKSRPSAKIENLAIVRPRILATGRMGIEIIQHETPEIAGGNISIVDAEIEHTGGVSYGIGISISGAMENIEISGGRLGNCEHYALEIVGGADRVTATAITFFGRNGSLVSNSGWPGTRRLSITGCRSDSGTSGRVNLANCDDAKIVDNEFIGQQMRVLGNRNILSNNLIRSNYHYGIIVEGGRENVVRSNEFDNSAAGENWAVMRAYGSGAMRNVFTENVLRKGGGGVYTDEIDGASSNIFRNNLEL